MPGKKVKPSDDAANQADASSYTRVFLIVMDSVGVGELPDAGRFGDRGSNTLGHIAQAANSVVDPDFPCDSLDPLSTVYGNVLGVLSKPGNPFMPRLALATLRQLGIGNIVPLTGIPPARNPRAFFGKMAEVSAGKDSTSGHWEMMGVIRTEPSRTFPNGFPPEMMKELEIACGVQFLLNKPYSGTEAIKQYGEEHIETRRPILYTSADSVLQIAAHTAVFAVARLYEMCEKAREIAVGNWLVDRVIARPFSGGIKTLDPLVVNAAKFVRMPERRDYSIAPPRTYLDLLTERGVKVTAVGKISDLFAGRGISESVHTKGNDDGMMQFIKLAKACGQGLYFLNLCDFDSIYGHRNDVAGYAAALDEFDGRLAMLLRRLKKTDLLIITADHGNDPTTPSTDHSREYVPLLVYSPRLARLNVDMPGAESDDYEESALDMADVEESGPSPDYGTQPRCLGIRHTFADVGATICENFGIAERPAGESFLGRLMET